MLKRETTVGEQNRNPVIRASSNPRPTGAALGPENQQQPLGEQDQRRGAVNNRRQQADGPSRQTGRSLQRSERRLSRRHGEAWRNTVSFGGGATAARACEARKLPGR